jgi:hypothetical protein
MNVVTAHPKLVTLGIGLTITFVIGTAIGMLENNQGYWAYSQDGNNAAGQQ